MPTTVTSILRDGVTASGVYPTLAAWRASLPSNLVTADEAHVLNVEAKSGGYNESLSFSGITTDATRNITIQPAAGHGHAGVFDDTKALFVIPVSTYGLEVFTDNLTIRGMQIQQTGVIAINRMVTISTLGVSPGTDLVTIERCIFKGSASGSASGDGGGHYGVELLDNTPGATKRALIRNNIFLDIFNSTYPISTGSRAISITSGRAWIYGNTIANCAQGIHLEGSGATTTGVLKNNLVACKSSLAGRIDYTIASGTLDGDSSNNASSDATAPGTSARTNQTFTFEGSGSGNYHLATGDTGALDHGLDLSSDADFPTSLDIDGQAYAVPWAIGADALVSVTNTITITGPASGRIYQSQSGVASITVSGTYTGTLTAIEAQVVAFGTTTPVSGFDWTTVVGSPSGEVFSFTLTDVPTGTGWYSVRVRDTVDDTIISTSDKIGVGQLIACAGQSNMGRFFNTGVETPNDLVRCYGNMFTGWQMSSGAGPKHLGDALVDLFNCPVGLVNGHSDGSSISQWDGGSIYTDAMTIFNAVGGKFGGLVFIQGEVDAGGTSYATYLSTLTAVLQTRFRAAFGQSSLPIALVANGRYTTDPGAMTTYGQIKQAHYDYADSDANCYLVDRIDSELSDGLHLAQAGSAKVGARVGQAFRVAYGAATEWQGPAISSITQVSATVYDVNITHQLGADISPSSGATGFVATDPGDSDAALSIASVVRQSATVLRITLSDTPVGVPVFSYADGPVPDVTDMVRDDSSLALPLGWVNSMAATVAAASGNVTADSGSVGGSAGVQPGIVTLQSVQDWDNTVAASTLIENIVILNRSTRAIVLALTNQTTDGSGNLAISNAALIPGTTYMVAAWNSDGSVRGFEPITAA